MDSRKHAGSFSFACENVIQAPQEQMGGGAGGGWLGTVGGALWIFRFRWMDLHGDLLQTSRIYMVICFIYMVICFKPVEFTW